MLDKLESLKIFCTAAETLKFRETATRLGIAPQLVTRAIAELEKTLGEMLFVRNTRQMKLTPFGQLFWPKAEALLVDSDMLFAEGNKHNSHEISGNVRITLPPLFENHDILRRLLQSLLDYPQLSIEWLPTDAHLNIIDEQIDIGIRIGTVPDNRFIVKTIHPVGVSIVAAPELVARHGMPDSLQDLRHNYPLSALYNRNSGRIWAWQFADGSNFFPVRPAFIATDISSELSAALSGRTYSQLADITVRPYLQRGELVNILPEYNFQAWQLYIFRPHQPLLPARVRLVFDLLTQILRDLFHKQKQVSRK
ncbi:LysR family transcriptional regulator [Pantoea sp. At-9b]|uniref:LysR family transcriptional regulator n=1 Tax=Pantoea sp. (strain At-9b) TaxID=592316 RepID=UPI0001B3E26F|nr:LysR family transcriptional regulator [Pantoea sp. At-9b]ADU72928.1 transcriptional regulator, LysR family [Pantoea sp. At-9b]